jgi:hypothetical protein
MSIKGFPTQKKLTTKLVNFTDKESITTNEFITAQQNYSDQVALNTTTTGLARLHPLVKLAEANTDSPKRVLVSTAHGASKGDVVRFDLVAANPYFEASVLSTPDADTIILSAELPNAIATNDEFYILRYTTSRLNADGSGVVVLTPSPVQYVYDGVDTEVELDTVVPANSRPLPIWYIDQTGAQVNLNIESTQQAVLNEVTGTATNTAGILADTNLLAAATGIDGAALPTRVEMIAGSDGTNVKTVRIGQELMVDSVSVVLASDQTPVPTTETINTSGSVVNGTLLTTVANSEAPPVNAKGFYLQNESTNANSIRFNIGGVASPADGVLLESGRSSDFVPIAATVSICNTVSSTQLYNLLWVIA